MGRSEHQIDYTSHTQASHTALSVGPSSRVGRDEMKARMQKA
jgi:hypothetical protein